jgi:hypothetical protein
MSQPSITRDGQDEETALSEAQRLIQMRPFDMSRRHNEVLSKA